jgi:hypothetical protein
MLVDIDEVKHVSVALAGMASQAVDKRIIFPFLLAER